MHLTANGYGHHQVQSVMNKQKKSVHLETMSGRNGESDNNYHYERNASAKDGREHHQLPVERARESSVHAILKQQSKNNLLIANHSKEKIRDRSHR